MVYLKPKQLIIKDCARRFVLKLYRHEASRGLFATAELLVFFVTVILSTMLLAISATAIKGVGFRKELQSLTFGILQLYFVSSIVRLV